MNPARQVPRETGGRGNRHHAVLRWPLWLGLASASLLLAPRADTVAGATLKDAAPPDVREFALTGDVAGEDGEAWVAADPRDPRHFVVAGIAISLGPALAIGVTNDAGRTWERRVLPVPRDARVSSDPVLAIGPDGIVHLAYIPADARGTLGVEVTRSLDGGRSFAPARRFAAGGGPDDKTAITVDANPASPYFGRVYLVWKHPRGEVFLISSADAGANWSSMRKISDDVITGHALATLADGTVVLSANRLGMADARGIVSYRSTDGGATFEPAVAVSARRGGSALFPPSACHTQGALIHTSLARTGSDTLVMAWDDYDPDPVVDCSNPCSAESSCRTHTRSARSVDGGRTWTAAAVATPPGWEREDQVFSWLAPESSNGALYLLQRATRDAPSRGAAHAWLLRSTDQGRSWQPHARLSAATRDGLGRRWQGDYTGAAASSLAIVGAWSDLRTGDANLQLAAVAPASDSIERHDGSYVDARAQSQGLLVDNGSDGRTFFAAWFTYEPAGGEQARPTWFVLQGTQSGSRAEFIAYRAPGGRYNGGSSQPLVPVGSGTIDFDDCDHARLAASGSEIGEVALTLTRLLPTGHCE